MPSIIRAGQRFLQAADVGGVHVSIVGTGMRWTIAEADADIALHGRKLRGCFETSGNEEPPRQPQALQQI